MSADRKRRDPRDTQASDPEALLSRRGFLGASAALPLGMSAAAAGMEMTTHHAAGTVEALEVLTSTEMTVLEAFCARLIPTDELGAGATEARVAHYIDRALAGPLMQQRATYAAGLSALDAFARDANGRPFAELEATQQDALLHELEAGKARGFAAGSAAFFTLVRGHAIEGMFCDPYYGGNADFVGWDLIGYPGVRMVVGPDEQRFSKPQSLRASAYGESGFGRKRGG